MASEDQPTSRTLTVSVKDTDGDWRLLTVLELRIAQLVEVYSDTGGVLSIRSAKV